MINLRTLIATVGIIVGVLLASAGVNAESVDIKWGKTPQIRYEKLVVEIISIGPQGQQDITKKQNAKPYIKSEIPAFVIEADLYGDLAWLEEVPTTINYGLHMIIESTGSFMHGEGTYGKVNITSSSVLTITPLFPDRADSTLVKMSGKIECLFIPGSLAGYFDFLPLLFVEGTKATLKLKKGERIKFLGNSVSAKEDSEIEFAFDAEGKAQTKVTKGVIESLGRAATANHTQFKPGEIWTDTSGVPINAHGGGILYYDKVYYWYGEIKTGKTWMPECNRSWGGTRVETVGVSCYSSQDLYNWKYEGNVLPAVKDDPQHQMHKSKVLERPKVLYNRATKQFVMWMHVDSEDYQLAHAGVATSDSPKGPFRYVGSFRPDGAMSRDMTVFMDDNGKAYLFYASENNATMHISLLTEDYLKPSGRFVRVFEGRSMEAPAVFKHHGRYYLIASGCTGWAPNAARSAVAESIWGPWKELGNPCRGPEAEVTFRGQSAYILPLADKPGTFIFVGDRWNQNDLPDSRYLWLPVTFTDKGFEVRWQTAWRLNN